MGRQVAVNKPLWTVARQIAYSDTGVYQRTQWYALEVNSGKKGALRSSYDKALADVPKDIRWRLQ